MVKPRLHAKLLLDLDAAPAVLLVTAKHAGKACVVVGVVFLLRC